MSLTLILIRHAKSDWDDPTLDDHDRPLNERGTASAKALGPWIAEREKPTQVLCSSAVRTQQTWELISSSLPPAEVHLISELYHAPALRMMEVLRRASGNTVAMVGHNPGIADFAASLAQSAIADHRFVHYPTGATTVFTFDAENWASIAPRSGIVTSFVVPRDLL